MGELPPSATSQGVDLFELERLRVLVRFEFDRDLTHEELVLALTRCHNNTREAYLFLKEQRRQAQLQAAAEMVAAAAATTASSPAHGLNGHVAPASNNSATSSNGGKRRNDSQDGNLDSDVQMDTPNKRHRSSTADAMTIDLSQPNDSVDMTQSTQQDDSESASPTRGRRPRHYNLERASQLIADTVGKIMQQSARASVDDVQWLSSAIEALAVKRTTELDEPLVVVVEALANALKHVPMNDVGAVQSDGVKQILEVLKQLPRQDQYTMELRLEPSTERLNEDVGKVDNTFACALADHMKKSERAQAARNAISVIKDALSACIARQESIKKSVQNAHLHRCRVRARIGDIKNDIQARLEQAGKDVKSSEQEMVHARNNQLGHTAAVMKVVMQHKEVFLSQGEDDADATLNAHAAIVHSTDPKVVRMRQEREESQLLHKARKQDVMRANTRLEFYQKLEALRQKVLPSVQDWLQLSARQVELLKEDAEHVVEDKLKLYVSKMIQSLRLYYEFHTMRQLLATKEREKQKETLNEHMEFYDDLVPSSKKEIENKIREFNGVIVHSTQAMREVASLQCELWEGKRKIFSPQVFAVVEDEYGKLWKALSGGAKDMMLDCVKTIRDQPSATPLVSSPVLVPASATPTPTVTPYEFVGREYDSHHPQPVRGSSYAPPSPVVDLTGDEDGDVTMDGSLGERFAFNHSRDHFSNQSMDEVHRPNAEPPTFSVVKLEETPSAAEIPPSVREFPMGSLLCWMQQDEFGEMDGVYTGHVKDRTPGGSYILEDADGIEHVIPVANLFTHEEKEAFSLQQRQGSSDDVPNKEGCVVM